MASLAENKQRRIYNIVSNLRELPKVSVLQDNGYESFYVRHEQIFVPDFKFEWCPQKEHFRVYIFVANRNSVKSNAGYTICNVNSGFTACGFNVLYGFLHKHRSNKKDDPLA